MWWGMEMVIRKSEPIACLRGLVGPGQSSNTQEDLTLSFRFFSKRCEKQPNGQSCFAWIGIGIHFVNKCSWTRSYHHFIPYHHHLFIYEESHHWLQSRSESRLFCISKAPWFCQDLPGFLPFFASLSSMRTSVYKPVQVSPCVCWFSCLFSCIVTYS
jgi:hypothetical protein